MKSLEQEAEEYFSLLDTTNDRTGEIEEENLQLLGHRRSFIAGAKSKWVQIQIIEDQIDVLYDIRNGGFNSLQYKIDELEQQLKELEDGETKI